MSLILKSSLKLLHILKKVFPPSNIFLILYKVQKSILFSKYRFFSPLNKKPFSFSTTCLHCASERKKLYYRGEEKAGIFYLHLFIINAIHVVNRRPHGQMLYTQLSPLFEKNYYVAYSE